MIIGTKFSTARFDRTVQPDGTIVLSAFDSDFGSTTHRHGALFGRLFDDACDRGFVLVSDRTGQEAPFYLDDSATERDAEGDVRCWHFKPMASAVRKVPALARYDVRVFNT